MEPAQVAERLGLGPLRRPASVLKDGEPYPVWKLTTDSGTWVVKVCRPPDFTRDALAQAWKLETAAWWLGVAMPEPHFPGRPAPRIWRPIDDDHLARATRFLEGTHPSAPLTPPLARWAGATIAALERLGIPADPAVDADFDTYPESDWDDWLDQARRLGVLDTAAAGTLKDTAMRINEIAEASTAEKLVMHRDFSTANILVTAEGPVLLDFDHAGPQPPWWELVSAAFYLAGPELGTVEPDRASVEACLAGYEAAGGRGGPRDETAFTGMLAGRLSTTAHELWMACGHRGGSPELQASFARALNASIPALAGQLDATTTWTAWLRALYGPAPAGTSDAVGVGGARVA
ncbi:phosphotransferase enzyme family protein [Glycomyces tenuis]|uniref:phosphotransferase enzyme family protein n=1 Tax=Glycomyces tenuis TaxID=58116 RepID=UPI00138AB7D9|nr:aminoglycoside phosphotransferase family protein [Glycomyces tenuis]